MQMHKIHKQVTAHVSLATKHTNKESTVTVHNMATSFTQPSLHVISSSETSSFDTSLVKFGNTKNNNRHFGKIARSNEDQVLT